MTKLQMIEQPLKALGEAGSVELAAFVKKQEFGTGIEPSGVNDKFFDR